MKSLPLCPDSRSTKTSGAQEKRNRNLRISKRETCETWTASLQTGEVLYRLEARQTGKIRDLACRFLLLAGISLLNGFCTKVCYIRFFSETLRLFEDLLEQVEQDYSSSNEDFTSARNRRPANAALELQRNRLGLTTA